MSTENPAIDNISDECRHVLDCAKRLDRRIEAVIVVAVSGDGEIFTSYHAGTADAHAMLSEGCRIGAGRVIEDAMSTYNPDGSKKTENLIVST